MSADEPCAPPIHSGEAKGASPDSSEHGSKTVLRLHPGGKGARSGISHNIHASCIVIRESGILIRGAAGAGKSSLAALVLAQARAEGCFAAWVADDRVIVKRQGVASLALRIRRSPGDSRRVGLAS